MKMKDHVSTQKMLVEELTNSFHLILEKLENMKDECVEDLDVDFPSWMETRLQNILETLDILMSEHRMEEALVVLEKEIQILQKLPKEKDSLLPIIGPFACAISDCKTRLAERFVSLAEHRRVTWSELHNTLFGLCRLGESDRASILLLKFFRSQLEKSVNELKHSAPFPHEAFTLELTKVVFSTISQAARSFVLLFGEASPYTSDLIQWARAELEVIFHSFDIYVNSISETSFALGLAVETMNISFSFCSLLEQEKLSLQSDVIKLMKPCMTKVLRMHFDQLRRVVSQFASTDNWVLGKFLMSGKLCNKPPLLDINGKLEYIQLTSSGRKFLTLVQMVLDDAFPLHALHLENLILKGLSSLFDEYTLSLERAIAIRGLVEECDSPLNFSAQKLHQHISILVNSFVLVHFLPTIVQNSFKSTIVSCDVVLQEQDKFSSQKDLDPWVQAIQESSDQLKSRFCQLFVSGVMIHGNSESMKDLNTCTCSHCLPGSSEDPMPSFVFQELFVRLRHLEEQFQSIALVGDGTMNSLLNGIMMTVILRLSENWEFLQSTKSHKQLLLDVHFLMEIARVGGYFSDNLLVAALDLREIIKGKLSTEEFQLNSEIPDEEWASNSAKLAIRILFEAEISETKSKYTPTIDCSNKCMEDNQEGTQEGTDKSEVNEKHVLCTVESRVRVDGEFVHSMEKPTRSKTQIMIIQHLQNPVTGDDDEGSSSPTNFNSCIENEQAVAGSVTPSERLSGANSIDELKMDDFVLISEEESESHSDLDATAVLQEIGKLTGLGKSESNKVEIQLLGILENLELNGNLEHQDPENSAHINGSPSDVLTGEAMPLVETKVVIRCTEVAETCHLEEKFSANESDQDDRSRVLEHEMNTCEVHHFERISIDECNGAVAVAVTTTNQWNILETKGGQETAKNAKAADRFKHSKAIVRLKHNYQTTDGIGKNKKERAARPMWQ